MVERHLGGLEGPVAPGLSEGQFGAGVQALHDAVQWDSDYLAEDAFADLPPVWSLDLKQKMGISEEYLLGVAPDPP